jgi:hypothetical protein
MNKTIWPILAVSTFFVVIISLASTNMPDEFKVERQSRWAKEDLLLASLTRYTDVYRSLTDEYEKEDLARQYLSIIIKEILVLPATHDMGIVHVVLPDTKGDKVIMVLKEIQLGPDNGLHGAMQALLNKRRRYEPPFYSPKIDKLIGYIVSGTKNEV